MDNRTDLTTDIAADLDRPAIRMVYHYAEVHVTLRPARTARRGTKEDDSHTGIAIAPAPLDEELEVCLAHQVDAGDSGCARPVLGLISR